MHSPKFKQKAGEFRRLLSSSILEKLWKKGNGVRDHMRKQIVPDAVEFLDFHIHHRQRCKALEALICAGDYGHAILSSRGLSLGSMGCFSRHPFARHE